ncbi:MAG: methyltransferase domain-containing protein [Alphaproteobacteria bacterium]|nr:methyltransferase domain-containing protein [Alphaproteobacteria bacterium]
MTATPFIGQPIDCPLCAGSDLIHVGNKDRNGAPLKTDLCRNCGHVFTNPQPTEAELNRFYSNEYRSSYKGVLTPKPKHVYRAGLRALERYVRLQPYLEPRAQVLDVGAGGGEFTYLMTRAGHTVRGIEPNRGYAEFAQSEYAVDIEVGTVSEAIDHDECWDVITLHHVLEHLANPVSVLRKLAQGLADKGVVIVEVPNVEARYHGPQRRFHFAHLHTFSCEGLTLAASKAGLEVRDLCLQRHTGHINVILSKTSDSMIAADTGIARRIEHHLETDTPIRDRFTTRPYRRLWANLARPIRERRALQKLGKRNGARSILDQIYAGVYSDTEI